jgi:hypothetical protein
VLDCGPRRGVAQSGSAPVWGTGGRRFKSGRPDQNLRIKPAFHGEVVPITPEGRLAATALMVLGIGLFAAITAIVTSFVLGPGGERPPVSTRQGELERLRGSGLVTDDEYQAARARIPAGI